MRAGSSRDDSKVNLISVACAAMCPAGLLLSAPASAQVVTLLGAVMQAMTSRQLSLFNMPESSSDDDGGLPGDFWASARSSHRSLDWLQSPDEQSYQDGSRKHLRVCELA